MYSIKTNLPKIILLFSIFNAKIIAHEGIPTESFVLFSQKLSNFAKENNNLAKPEEKLAFFRSYCQFVSRVGHVAMMEIKKQIPKNYKSSWMGAWAAMSKCYNTRLCCFGAVEAAVVSFMKWDDLKLKDVALQAEKMNNDSIAILGAIEIEAFNQMSACCMDVMAKAYVASLETRIGMLEAKLKFEPELVDFFSSSKNWREFVRKEFGELNQDEMQFLAPAIDILDSKIYGPSIWQFMLGRKDRNSVVSWLPKDLVRMILQMAYVPPYAIHSAKNSKFGKTSQKCIIQ